MRKLILASAVAVLAVVVTPVPALATGEGGATGVGAVFTGNASVTPGLCAPGGGPGCSGPSDADYNFTIPGNPAPMPALCQAAGLFEGSNAVGGCAMIANGELDGITTPEPACGNATGTSAGTNNVTFAGITRTHAHGFLTTAGSVVPVTGTIDDADADTDAGPNDHVVVALVQAFPVTPSGTIPCVTTPAETFIAVGIAVVA